MMSSHWLLIVFFLAMISFVNSKCIVDGRAFEPFRVVYNVYDDVNDWCLVGLCKRNGEIWKLVDLSCRRKSLIAKSKVTTPAITAETTEQVTRCIYEGAEYSPGSEIFRGVDEKKGVCYTLICSIKGKVVTGSRKRCTTTEQPFTTGPRIDGGYQKYSTKKSDLETLQKLNNVTTAVLFPDTTSQPINTVTEQKTKKFLWSEPTTSKEATPRFTEPVGCQVNGKFFPPGAEISEGYDESSDWCYGEYCNQYGEVINWDTWDCKGKFSSTGAVPTTEYTPTAPPATEDSYTDEITVPPIRKSSCYHNGKLYNPGEEISKDYDRKTGLCRRMYCDGHGEIANSNEWNCKEKGFSTEGYQLTTFPRAGKYGCYHNGRHYKPGEYISKEYDETTDTCYGKYCDHAGSIISWDDWNCKGDRVTTVKMSTSSTPDSTTIPVTRDHIVEKQSTEQVSERTSTIKETFGSLPPPTKAPTVPPTEYTTIPPYGCYSNGEIYKPGESISEGYDEYSDWCYGQYCDENGNIISWDTWNCKRQPTLPPTTLPTTAPQTEIPTTEAEPLTIASTCRYNSLLYSYGDTVYDKYDGRNNWCYGLYCSNEGHLVYWDKWNCKELTTPSAPLLQKMVKTDVSPSADAKGFYTIRCVYKGHEYLPRQFIKKDCSDGTKCSVLFCNHNGVVVPKILRDISRKEGTFNFK